MNLLEVTNVSKSYGRVKALEGVSFVLNQGEVAALVGPNESGKTTLLKIIAGVNAPTSGKVTIMGANPMRQPQIKFRFGLMPDLPGLYENLRPLEHLRVFQMLYGQDDVERCEAQLQLVGINRTRHRSILLFPGSTDILSASWKMRPRHAHRLSVHSDLGRLGRLGNQSADNLFSNHDASAWGRLRRSH